MRKNDIMITGFIVFAVCYIVLAFIVVRIIHYILIGRVAKTLSINSRMTEEYGSDWYERLTEEIYHNPKCMSNNAILDMHKRFEDHSYVYKWEKKYEDDRSADITMARRILDKRY